MREVKFRAWAKHWKLMSNKLNLKNGLDFFHFENSDAPHILSVSNTILDIMQYTGLKDKNGVEIYEGDIVSVGKPKSRFNHDIANVVFYNGCFMLKSVDFEDETKEHFTVNYIYRGYYEIIGNIHENQELLEQS